MTGGRRELSHRVIVKVDDAFREIKCPRWLVLDSEIETSEITNQWHASRKNQGLSHGMHFFFVPKPLQAFRYREGLIFSVIPEPDGQR